MLPDIVRLTKKSGRSRVRGGGPRRALSRR